MPSGGHASRPASVWIASTRTAWPPPSRVAPTVRFAPRLGLDIDRPEDLVAFMSLDSATRTHAYLSTLDLDTRLRRQPAIASRSGSAALRRSERCTMSDWLEDLSPDRDLTDEEALALGESAPISQGLMQAASARRDPVHGSVVSYSRKVFVPLTQLCRDVCHYCTFAHAPGQDQARICRWTRCWRSRVRGRPRSARKCCSHSVTSPSCDTRRHAWHSIASVTTRRFRIWWRPRARWSRRDRACCRTSTPVVSRASDLAELRRVSISQGIMLESASERLCEPGQPHHGSPDKRAGRSPGDHPDGRGAANSVHDRAF